LVNLVGFFCRTMSAGSPQCRVRQRTEGDRAALRAKIMDRPVIAERNVIRSDIMVAPLDNIHDTIQTYHWGYLHSCACVVYTRLVRLFYANLEVVQDDDRRLVLQSTVLGHIITIDPQIISQVIGVPVLQLSVSPYNEVVLPPSMEDLREFFHAVRQGEECATTIRIGALSTPHRMVAKIVQHNLWPIVRRNDLILKRAQFVYAISLRLPFCLCKHILDVILEAHDESNTGLPFGCLLTQIILQSGIGIASEPKMKIQDPLSKQTLMKSNAQQRRNDPDDDDVPSPPPIPVGISSVASSSQTAPSPQPDVNYSQITEALAAIQGGMSSMQLSMSSMQQSISTMHQEVHSINLWVEQNQPDLWECLKFHHPSSSDDEDDAPMAEDT
jgi:hypothetical protein